MNYQGDFYPESRVGGFTSVDGTIAFYTRVNALLRPEHVLVDIGCGRGAYGKDPIEVRRSMRVLQGKCAQVIGIDVDRAAAQNPFIDEFRWFEGSNWPLEDESADLCLADNVLEHVQDVDQFFAECRRVLKPGGWVCIRTPNLLSYFGFIARLVPNQQHVEVLKSAKEHVHEQDVFPTYYRCNTIPCIRRQLRQHGFEPFVYGYEAEPSYLSFSRIAYLFGVLHQRLAPNLFRVGIHAFGKKRA